MSAPEFVDEHVLRVGETDFWYQHPLNEAPDGYLGIEKIRPLIEAYLDLWARERPRRVVELGIRRGGSTALLCELGVERIVSVELAERRVDALDRFIAARGVGEVVRPYFGVDQSDRERLASIVDAEFGGEPIDLVVDDASHLYRESRASFEVLFPRLAPGGLYMLEDWRWQQMVAARYAQVLETDAAAREALAARMVREDRAAPDTAMARLVLELVLVRGNGDGVVSELTVGADWAAVRRGPAELDPATFRLDDHAGDHTHLLAPVR